MRRGGDVTDVDVASGLRRQQERRVHGNRLHQGRSRFRVRQRVLAPGGPHAVEPIAQELMVLGVESIGQSRRAASRIAHNNCA